MSTPPLQDALAQVRLMRGLLLTRRPFHGYSGRARIAGGLAALLGAAVLAHGPVPATPRAHLAVWALVLAVSVLLNYGALALWFYRQPAAGRAPSRLLPAADAVPALLLGGTLSVALVWRGQFDLLFGVWMCLFGLAHVPYRQVLPRLNFLVGLFYMACGVVCLLHPAVRWLQPWPMGLVFGCGETLGGLSFIYAKLEDAPHDSTDAPP